jgi:hypothetical protein
MRSVSAWNRIECTISTEHVLGAFDRLIDALMVECLTALDATRRVGTFGLGHVGELRGATLLHSA